MKGSPFAPGEVVLDQIAVSQALNVTEHRTLAQQSFLCIFDIGLPNIGLPLVVQMVKNLLQCRRPQFYPWVERTTWRRDRLPTPVFLGFPDGSDAEESACKVGNLDWIPELGRSPGEGNGNPL